MKVLIDECVDPSIAALFTRHEAKSVLAAGLTQVKNGELLSKAQHEFDAFITVDTGIPYQQKLAAFDLVVILLRVGSNRADALWPFIPRIEEILDTAEPRSLHIIQP